MLCGVDGAEIATYLGASQYAVKVLGPTADLLGENLKDLAQRRTENLRRIFSSLEHKFDVEGGGYSGRGRGTRHEGPHG
jgi:hypothetical protein